ncbi:hypothetical protein AAFF_G00244350 [Aldrovandia affinis]|uniref:Gypsy retrotransposon integrase-like protein 1 n=1 Tax=Aldrovandia affinis TaxID=143900 RepID=A0AAD7RE91_9TELE|nr:hypothetical protein AAFF_G00244350 [Aldrovandia affinis]
MRPLYGALRGKTGNAQVDWGEEMTAAFDSAKQALAEATMLSHPVPDAPIALTTDASDYAVGAVLEQLVKGTWRPLAFFSKQLRPNEKKYSAFDRELLGLYLAIRHFRFSLEGRDFPAYVDHKPLVFAMAKAAEPWSARQQRNLAYISEFTTDIRHIEGKANAVADCLSRPSVNAVHLGIDIVRMAADQQADPEVQAYRTAISGLKLADIKLDGAGASLLCDVSTGQPRPVVPAQWRRGVFDSVHSLSHPGQKASQRLVSSKYVWHGLKKDVREWAAGVHGVPAGQDTSPRQKRHWRFLRSRSAVLTMLTWTSSAPYLPPICHLTAVPSLHRSCGRRWPALGVRLHHTTAFHPQANGLCERFHRSMKAALRASLKDDSWTDRLPQRPALLNKANAFKPVPTSQHGLPRAWIPTDLSTAQYVFIRHNAHRSPLKPPYDGPFRVMETGDKTFIVDVGGKPERITVDRLKPTHQALDQPVVPAAAPRRGRPPSIRPTRAAQVPSPDVAPQTTAATLPRTRAEERSRPRSS